MVTARELIDAGLGVVGPHLSLDGALNEEGWEEQIAHLRDAGWTSGNFTLSQQTVDAARAIALLFGKDRELPIFVYFVALMYRRGDDPRLLHALRAIDRSLGSETAAQQSQSNSSNAVAPASTIMPEVQEAQGILNIARSIRLLSP